MTKAEMRSELYKVNDLIEDYACYFIDWERLYYESGYKPEFPQKLLDVQKSVKAMIEELRETIKSEKKYGPMFRKTTEIDWYSANDSYVKESPKP